MFTYQEKVGGMNLMVADYLDLGEFANDFNKRKFGNRPFDVRWAGGDEHSLNRGCTSGDEHYAERAAKLVDKIANLTIQDYDVTLEWNESFGELDYEAAMAGEVECCYGPTIDLTEKSPVNIYLDMWTLWSIPTDMMMRRGVAMLALVQALSVFRPVNAYAVSPLRHWQKDKDVLQVLRLPTNPMDISRASWAIASPVTFRVGFQTLLLEILRTNTYDSLPMLSNDAWQKNKLGDWLANRDGVKDVVHLGPMMTADARWESDESALAWVKSQVARFVEAV